MRNKIAFLLLGTLTLFFSACLDTEEKIVVKADNSGIYSLRVDMGKMIALAQQMDQGKNPDKVPEKKDSLILFKSIVDTATALSQKEKEMLRDGSLTLHMDEAANEMVIQFNLPFKNISQLGELRATYFTALDKLNLSKKMKENEGESTEDDNNAEMGSSKNLLSPGAADVYLFKASPGKISNSLSANPTDKSILPDSTLQMMQQMSAFMGDAHYKTIVVLPKPAKKYTGSQPEISADKKTVSFNTTFTELMATPSLAEFNVEY